MWRTVMWRTVERPVSPTVVAAGVALWLVAMDNLAFWSTFWRAMDLSPSSIAAAVLLGLVLWSAATAVLRLAAPRALAKPMWALLLVASAVVAHFVDGWGVLIDKGMARSILQTDLREATELLSTSLVLDVLLRGVLPALVVLGIPIKETRRWDLLKGTAVAAAASAVTLGVALSAFYPLYASTFRNNRELRLQLVPSNVVSAMVGVLKPSRAGAPVPIAVDAARSQRSARPLLLVLVVGETARADNFSLGGYERPTNEALDGRLLTYFRNVTSCGTDTATSLPCMFSDLGVDRFSAEAATSRQNVLDVLQRTGVSVRWIENNSGCKGVCDRMPTFAVQALTGCSPPDCFDDSLADALGPQIASTSGDALIVLHQLGSHGPAYYKRHPTPARFEPACRSSRLQECDRQSVINAYDNTIAYTSAVLARKLDALSRVADRDVALLYVSDHGESLGESGVYLHGMPRWLAPHEQSHVPMLLWMNEGARARLAPDAECLRSMAQQRLSHDNLFHTLLGAFDVRTQAYNPRLDVLAPTRGAVPCPGPPVSFRPQPLV